MNSARCEFVKTGIWIRNDRRPGVKHYRDMIINGDINKDEACFQLR